METRTSETEVAPGWAQIIDWYRQGFLTEEELSYLLANAVADPGRETPPPELRSL